MNRVEEKLLIECNLGDIRDTDQAWCFSLQCFEEVRYGVAYRLKRGEISRATIVHNHERKVKAGGETDCTKLGCVLVRLSQREATNGVLTF